MAKESKKVQVPRLRFPEFLDSGAWAQKKVEDYFDVGSSKRVLQQDWTTKGIPFYRTRELVSLSKGEPFASEIFIAEKLFHEITEKYGAPKEGDFLVSGVGTLGISCLVKSDDKFYFKDGNVLWFAKREDISSKYFKYCFESDGIQNQIVKQASVSTVGTYTIQNAKTTKLLMPPKVAEQQKIADCLSSLDELIAAQGRKFEALKTYKRGLMQQLFPREGKTLPRLRFPEFRDAQEWEEHLLSQISPVIYDGTHQTPTYTSKGVPFYSVENLISGNANKFISHDDYLEATRKNRPQKNDILLTRIGKIGHSAVVTWDHEFSVYVTLAVIQRGPKFDSCYMHYFIQSERYRSELRSRSLPNAVPPKINLDSLRSTKVLLPEKDEQQRIAECLSALDNQISAASARLNTLKSHKKGLMQQLFPSLEEV